MTRRCLDALQRYANLPDDNLPDDIQVDKLGHVLSFYGTVTRVALLPAGSLPGTSALASFESQAAAQAAIDALDGVYKFRPGLAAMDMLM